MTYTKRDLRHLRNLAALPTDELDPGNYATLDGLVKWAGDIVRRVDQRAEGHKEAQARKTERRGPLSVPDANRDIVRMRSGGMCEVRSPECKGQAQDMHHIAGRGWKGCHHPSLLIHVCGHGNTDGCHGYIHADAERAKNNGWRMDRADAARLLGLSADRLGVR